MKTTFTHISNSVTRTFCIRRALILLTICVFAPGCIQTHCSNSPDTSCHQRPELLAFADNTVFTAIGQMHGLALIAFQSIKDYAVVLVVDSNRIAANGINSDETPGDLPKPLESIRKDHAIDPHNTNIEDRPIVITLPALMRIAIMVFFIIIMV